MTDTLKENQKTDASDIDAPCLIQQLQNTVQDVIKAVDRLDNDGHRSLALAEAQKLVNALQRPEKTAFGQMFESFTYNICLRLAVDLKLFRKLVERNGEPISAAELAGVSGAEELFIVRIMRPLTAGGYAAETGLKTYVSTPLTRAMTIPAIEAGLIYTFDHTNRVHTYMPEYFQRHGYKCPTDGRHGPFQYAFNTDQAMFEYIHSDPERTRNFNTYMRITRTFRRHWTEYFPVEEALLEDYRRNKKDGNGDGEILLVDIGGGSGHDLQRFAEKFPQAVDHNKNGGRNLVLQDLPRTIGALEPSQLHKAIRPMVHDMFTPQPIKGAKAYYTHIVLHDWPDAACRQLLSHLRDAMKPGYSRLLINEIVLPNVGCASGPACVDITMMTLLAGMERSRRQWEELLGSVGLKVISVWFPPQKSSIGGDWDCEGVVEAVVPEPEPEPESC